MHIVSLIIRNWQLFFDYVEQMDNGIHVVSLYNNYLLLKITWAEAHIFGTIAFCLALSVRLYKSNRKINLFSQRVEGYDKLLILTVWWRVVTLSRYNTWLKIYNYQLENWGRSTCRKGDTNFSKVAWVCAEKSCGSTAESDWPDWEISNY